MADDPATPSPAPTLPSMDIVRAAMEADREARKREALAALQAAMDAHRCRVVVWVDAEIGGDGITRHRPRFDVEALS